jgi:CRISPR-associated protein Csb1
VPHDLTLEVLLEACAPGGPSALTSTTELAPAAGWHAAVAPAKFAAAQGDLGTYAYEKRYEDGVAAQAVIIDSKQSQLNRAEQALVGALADGHPLLARLPRIRQTYTRGGVVEERSDLVLPHRAFDGHIRAGTVDGTPVTQLERYRAMRDADQGNARALFDASPVSVVFGAWDSSRGSRQGRWRSLMVGEIVGFCADATAAGNTPRKGGARVDPVGMQIQLTEKDLKDLAARQRDELSPKTYDKIVSEAAKAKTKGRVSASQVGLGGIPPTLAALGGVACRRIVRSHVLTFAGLRQIRFGSGADGDVACRALLAALALDALARSDDELVLRANCDLVEAGPTSVTIDRRGGTSEALNPLTIAAADELLAAALAHAESAADVVWDGPVMHVEGDPAIVKGAVDDEDGEAGQ